MEKLTLKAEQRNKEESLKKIRSSKKIPCVVYGHKQESETLKVDYSDFLRTYRKAWENHIITLELNSKKMNVLIHEVQKNPITWDFIHIDFYTVTAWEKVHTKIPLKFVWNSKAAQEWAIIEELVKELEVKCLPTNLVDNIEVDLSSLKEIWDTIKVSDLNIDKKFDILTPKEEVIVLAWKPSKAKEENTSIPATEATTENTEETTK